MRKLVAVGFLLLFSTSSIDAQKTRLGQEPETRNSVDYSINLHFSATHIRPYCIEPGSQVTCSNGLYADALLNGKKLELRGSAEIIKHNSALIVPGSYRARLTKDIHNTDSTVIDQEYDILLPDNTVWHCVITGISE